MTETTTPAAPPEMTTAERARLAEATGPAEDDLFTANPWYEWGPYLSERAWGTVREDYSDGGDAWLQTSAAHLFVDARDGVVQEAQHPRLKLRLEERRRADSGGHSR